MKNLIGFRCSHGSASRRERLYRPQGGGYTAAFSLVEVVIALGIITVGVTAVLALFPTALQSGHSAQDETRAAHIAQSVFGSLVAGASSQFTNVRLPLYASPSPAPTPLSINLTTNSGTI